MRLFVIGNGFDLDHGIKSRFEDFKAFLERSYVTSFNKQFVAYPNVGTDRDGALVANPNDAAQIMYALLSQVPISSDWSDFEDCLGKLDYREVLDLVEEDEEHPFRYYYNLEDLVRDFETSILFAVSDIFGEWVQEIDIAHAKRKYRFSKMDLFLTFNYTNTLEDIYGIPENNICHIHGSCENPPCITGHAKTNRSFDGYDEIVAFDIQRIHNLLRKPVESIYSRHSFFFDVINSSSISEIIFFGFSFGDADQFYIKQLFKNVDSHALNLYLSSYEHENEMAEKLSALEDLGFKGHYCGAFDGK